MHEYVTKLKIRGRIILSLAIITALTSCIGIPLFSLMPDFGIAVMMLSCWSSIALFITYFVKFFWFGHTFKQLKKSGLEHALDDIDLTAPTFPKAQIFCGKDAFFCKKTGSVVAYEQLAWIYNAEGQIGEYIIRLKNGKRAAVTIKDNGEMLSLINNYVTPKNPRLIEGKTVQAKNQYLKLYPKAASAKVGGKTIGGSLLSLFSIVCFISALINGRLDIGTAIVIGVMGAVGLGILFFGLKEAHIVSYAVSVQEWFAQSVFFNTLCKIGTVLALACLALLLASGALELEPLFVPSLIGYGIGMLFLIASLALRTGFFAKPLPTYSVKLPEEMLDDISLISGISASRNDNLFLYSIRLAKVCCWDDIRTWVDHLLSADFSKDNFALSVGDSHEYTDITKAYLKSQKTGAIPGDGVSEHRCAKVTGKSKVLKSFVGVVFYNQAQTVDLFLSFENKKIATVYAETLLRCNFNTPDQMKLAKPIPPAKPVSLGSGCSIYVDSAAFVKYLTNPSNPAKYEFCGCIPLTEKEPVLCLYEDGIKTREYRLQTKDGEDFTGKYFLISVRLGMTGVPVALTAQIDGFISDTPEQRKMTMGDIGYRMEGHFFNYNGGAGKQWYEMSRGQDLPMKGLKYPGYTTPANIRLIGICPDCGKSFCFHGYAFYRSQSDVAYSDDGLDCCEIRAYNIDKDTWSLEADGKTFRYYNSFNCPHCGTPYIDYKRHPENKVFGVSGCVLLGRTAYQDNI